MTSDEDMLVAVATAIHLVDCEAKPCEWQFYPKASEVPYAAAAIEIVKAQIVTALRGYPWTAYQSVADRIEQGDFQYGVSPDGT